MLFRTYGAIEVWNIFDMTAVICRNTLRRFFFNDPFWKVTSALKLTELSEYGKTY